MSPLGSRTAVRRARLAASPPHMIVTNPVRGVASPSRPTPTTTTSSIGSLGVAYQIVVDGDSSEVRQVVAEIDQSHAEACWSQTTCPGGSPAAPAACLACIGSLLARPAATTNPPTGETYRDYSYDPVGNRLTEVSNAGTTTHGYNSADRLTSTTAPGNVVTAYTFDSNGNQTAAGARTFTYDLADRLKTATISGTTETYTYAGDGTRLSAATGSQANKTTKFLWDRAFGLPQLAIERNGNNALLRSYRYAFGRLSQTAGSSTYYYHPDGLGSVADVTGSTGTALSWAEYYPYGIIRQAGADRTAPAVDPFRFAGQQLDATTGLYYLRARQYDPGTGRFLSTDPVSPAIAVPYTAAYGYVKNRPILGTDPSGECWPLCFAAVGALVGGVINTAAYALTNSGNLTLGGAIGAFAGGAIAGAATAVAGPFGGSIGLAIAGSSIGLTAVGATVAIGAAGGAVGAEVSSLIATGQNASPSMLLKAALINGAGGYIGNAAFPMRGVGTASQAELFAPQSLRTLLGQGTNAVAAQRTIIASALFGTAQNIYPWGK
jgi:RHS repeat-associated protein